MAEQYSSTDVIRIEILGQQAVEILQQLLVLVQRLEAGFQQMGISADAVLPKILGPLSSIQASTAQTVRELQLLRETLGGLGPAATGPERAAAGLGEVGAQAAYARAQIDALLASLQATLALPTAPIAGYLGAPGPGRAIPMGGYVPGGPPIYVGPTSPIPLAAPPERPLLAERAGPSGIGAAIAGSASEAEREVARLNVRIEELEAALAKAQERTDRYSISWQRHAFWLIRAFALYAAWSTALRVVGDITFGTINILSQFDLALERIGFITQATGADLIDMSGAITDIAIAYAQLPTEALPAWEMAAQATKDQAEQLALVDAAAKLAVMSGMDMTQATEYLVAIQRQWRLEASALPTVLDMIAEGYRSGVVSMAEMTQMLAQSGAIAHATGLTMGEYVGATLGIVEATSLSATQVSNLIERLSASMYTTERAKELMEEYGIAVYEAVGEEVVRRPMWDVLRDIATLWQEMTDSQRSAIAELVAGRTGVGGYKAEVMGLLSAFEDVDREIVGAGQHLEYLGRIQGTLPYKTDQMRGAWQDVRIELGLSLDTMTTLKDMVGDITGILMTWSDALQLSREAGISLWAQLWGEIRGYTPEQIMRGEIERIQRAIELERERPYREAQPLEPTAEALRQSRERIRIMERQLAELRTREAAPLYTPMPERWGPEIWEYPGRVAVAPTAPAPAAAVPVAPPPYPYTIQILEAEELTWAQIVELQEESARRVEEVIAANQALYQTEAERIWIEEEIRAQLEGQIVLVRDQQGVLHAIRGERAAYLRDLMREMDTMQMGFQRLRDFTPEMLAQIEPLARYYQQLLEAAGFYEEPRQVLLMGENEQLILLNIGMTYLRLAIEALTEVEQRQLEGQWNLPAGAVAYVPISSLWYQRQGAAGGLPVLPEGATAPIPTAGYGFVAPRALPPQIAQWWDFLQEAGTRYGLDPFMLAALMQIESGGKAGAISKAGAVGLMQVMPREAGFAGRPTGTELLDPHLNVMFGASLFAELLQRWQDPLKAAAAYFGALSPGGQITGAADVSGTTGFGYVQAFKEAYSALTGTGAGMLPATATQPVVNVPAIEIPTIHAEFTIRNVIILEGAVVQQYVNKVLAEALTRYRRSGGTSGAGGPSRR